MSEALRLADLVEHDPLAYSDDAAAELRRLSAELAAIKAAIEAQGVAGDGRRRSMSNMFVYSRSTGSAEQAAPQASVPAMSHVARRKLGALVADGHEVCGVMIQRVTSDGVQRGSVSAGGMVIWWQPEQAQGVPDGLSDDALSELAHSANQEALSFGLGHDLFLRYFRTLRNRALASAPPAPQAKPQPLDVIKDAFMAGFEAVECHAVLNNREEAWEDYARSIGGSQP